MLATVLADIRVPRLGRGRARTRPNVVIADRAYATGVIREQLRRRHIKAVIPAKSDQIAARLRRGSAGGCPNAFDAQAYKDRNLVERSFNKAKQWRGLATRYDKLAITYRARRHVLRHPHLATHIRETRPSHYWVTARRSGSRPPAAESSLTEKTEIVFTTRPMIA